jgi:hypothetical protein
MSSFRRRSPPVEAPAAEAMSVVPAQSLCCPRLTENGDATSEKNPQNGSFAGSSIGRAGCRNCTSGRARSSATRFRPCPAMTTASEFSFWTNRVGSCRGGGARGAAAGRLSSCAPLAKSDWLPKGGCALKRLSEDFRIWHGHGSLDQDALRDRPMSRSVHLFYHRLTDLARRRERSRKREAVALIDRRPQFMRLDDTHSRCSRRSPQVGQTPAKATGAADVAIVVSHAAVVSRLASPARSPPGVVLCAAGEGFL